MGNVIPFPGAPTTEQPEPSRRALQRLVGALGTLPLQSLAGRPDLVQAYQQARAIVEPRR